MPGEPNARLVEYHPRIPRLDYKLSSSSGLWQALHVNGTLAPIFSVFPNRILAMRVLAFISLHTTVRDERVRVVHYARRACSKPS
ncbi:hypothetical protein MPTK1_4g09440 [Marchantia polymorpha subsp. ruderalis]|uniref:Uncharacterized protein n=2 Tax=Marchantia polymorpha TaxID=3197 RepID=A0AAF6B837_MARPO|nr:hypothetical protein MARPO_0112s0044 [Marchantia polymorpha]BBN08171.1 hypothetical protein Mp_4g09440 [Marchantia polymorpha subsp. ruderalis]|eukprot:PTQ31396.1 hypothetical protein MARPO_0112s0044 [Marchantia polymorpha]